jgi:hypothetical protein
MGLAKNQNQTPSAQGHREKAKAKNRRAKIFWILLLNFLLLFFSLCLKCLMVLDFRRQETETPMGFADS